MCFSISFVRSFFFPVLFFHLLFYFLLLVYLFISFPPTTKSKIKQKQIAKKVILAEEFDEGLVVLRDLMGWDMIDVTYSSMLKTQSGSQRWDGKELQNTPRFEDLPDSVRGGREGGGEGCTGKRFGGVSADAGRERERDTKYRCNGH